MAITLPDGRQVTPGAKPTVSSNEHDQIERLREALCLLYDMWEGGTPCSEGDEMLGNAFKLTKEEEDEVLALIPRVRSKPAPAPETSEPPEPTPEMIRQGIWAWERAERGSTFDDVRAIYIAMRRMEGRSQKASEPRHMTADETAAMDRALDRSRIIVDDGSESEEEV